MFSAKDYFIAPVEPRTARALIEKYHYSKGASNTATYIFGLYKKGTFTPLGVSWWIPPAKGSVDKFNPGGHKTTLCLHRLVIAPEVERNAASFLIAGSIREIARLGRYDFLITYADTFQGHTGIIYRATNWTYQGLTRPRPVFTNPEGRMKGLLNGSSGTLLTGDLKARGFEVAGYYSKHCYTMRLKIKRAAELGTRARQLNFMAEAV